jgi:serine/threonine-protein kinase RsbW
MNLSPRILSLTNKRAELRRLAAWVDEFATTIDLGEPARGELQVALEEVASNVIKHGYPDGATHTFSVSLSADAEFVTAVVTDDAPAFDPLARAEVDIAQPLAERPIGGLGIHLVRHLMDAVGYERSGAQNVLTLRRRRASTEPVAEM